MPISEVHNCDCMDFMRDLPDNAFDLVIADPPYGIGEDGLKNHSRGCKANATKFTPKSWDKDAPQQSFFDELLRIGKYVVIWGANHFISRIPIDSHCWIVWDKDNGQTDFADCELAWTNMPFAVRKFKYKWQGMLQENMSRKEERIHPCQKPIALYGWILRTFLPKIGGGKIFDPMMGSGSSRIAAYKLGYDFWGCELDKEYFGKANERFEKECHGVTRLPDGTTIRQLSIFD